METNIPLTEFNDGQSGRQYVNVPTDGEVRGQYVNVQVEEEPSGLRHRPSARSAADADDLVQRLPSRQLADAARVAMAGNTWRKKTKKKRPGYHTIRLQRDDAHQLATELMGDEDFVDAPEGLQNEEIRELPTAMHRKKAVQDEVKRAKRKEKRPSVFKTMGYSASLAWKRFNENLDELTYSLELWAGHLKKIEGNFGSGVTSYFLFLKWLFIVNIPLFFLVFFFVTLPQLLYRYMELGGYKNSTAFKFEHIFTGSGWLNETELYYGGYSDDDVGVTDLEYLMPLAYFFTLVIYYIVILVVTAGSLVTSYRKNFIEASDEFNFYYVSKVFCGWSFSVDNPRTADLKHKSIFKEFQEYLSGFRRVEEKKSCEEWCSIFALRVLTNLLVLLLLGGSGYLVWYISVTQSLSNQIAFLSEMALPLCISLVNFVLPFAFSILASFEKYKSPRTELYMTMIRTITLNIVTLGVLIYFWYNSVDCSKRDIDDQKWLDSELECRPCWENFMGENLYRLVIVDFIFILVITFLSEFVRRLMSQFCCKSLGRPEFNIGRNTLNLIYSQGLVWLGTFYCPLLPFIMALKLLVIFYVKRYSVTQNCVPSVKPWKGGRTHTVIMGLMFIFYFLCLVAVLASLVVLKPSEVCGPYQGYNATYDVVLELVDKWKDQNEETNRVVSLILEMLTSVAFVLFVFIVVCVVVHYSRVMSDGYQEMVNLLRKQIALEGKDKAFLLKLLQQASKAAPPPPAIPGPSERGSGEPATTPGGRQFAKQTVGSVSHATGTPPSRRRQDRTPQSAPARSLQPPTSATSDHHNPMYTLQSHNMSAGSSLDRTMEGATSPSHNTNPAYDDRSPARRPNLPYPSQYMSPGDQRL